MPTRRQLIGAGAASVALTAMAANPLRTLAQDATPPGDDDAQSGAKPVVGTPVLRPAIDLVRAQEIALEGNTGAVVNKVELDGDDGVLKYSVKLDNGMEVHVDATTGAIIKTESSGNGDDEHDDDSEHDDSGDDQSSGDDSSGEGNGEHNDED